MGETKIAWSDSTWNPVTGCTKVSSGCKHCYAERVSKRTFAGQVVELDKAPMDGNPYRPRRFTDVRCHPERLDQPLRWRKPRRVFVNSMSDLFHEDVPDEFIDSVFAVMAHARKHTFQVLTKRPERMRLYLNAARERVRVEMHDIGRAIESTWSKNELLSAYAKGGPDFDTAFEEWPKRNVWLGVSCEDQKTADERIPILLDTPAAVRFVSCEPLLGPIDMHRYLDCQCGRGVYAAPETHNAACPYRRRIHWIIVGGESGPGWRPMKAEWAEELWAQCHNAGVPFFAKQGSGMRPGRQYDLTDDVWACKEMPDANT